MKTPNVPRRTALPAMLILMLVLAIASPPARAANQLQYFFPIPGDIFTTIDDSYGVGGIRWGSGAEPQFILYNPNGFVLADNSIPSDEILFALRRAAREWNRSPTAGVEFDESIVYSNSDLVDPPVPTEPVIDGRNFITFRSGILGTDGDVLAGTLIEFTLEAISAGDLAASASGPADAGGMLPFDVDGDGSTDFKIAERDYATGEIVEVDVVFNPSTTFVLWPEDRDDIPPAQLPEVPGSNDIQGIATHEFGHALGIAHSYIQDATMFPFLRGGDFDFPTDPYNERTPNFDDQMAQGIIYNSIGTGGTIEGEVLDGQFMKDIDIPTPTPLPSDPEERAAEYRKFVAMAPVFIGRPASVFGTGFHPDNISSDRGAIRLIAQVLTGRHLRAPSGGSVLNFDPMEDDPDVDFFSGAYLDYNSSFSFPGLPAAADYVVYLNANRLDELGIDPIAINRPYPIFSTLLSYPPEFFGGSTCQVDTPDGYGNDDPAGADFITVANGAVTRGITITTNLAGAETPCPTPSPTATPTELGNNGEITEIRLPALAPPAVTIPISVTARNTGAITWSEAGGYKMAIDDPCGILPTRISLAAGATVTPGGSYTFTGEVALPAGARTCSPSFQLFQEGVELFGYSLSATISIGSGGTTDFTANGGAVNRWLGGTALGSAQAVVGATGLCMGVPLEGDNIAVWVSPERYIELVDNSVWRLRIAATTNQQATDAIPLWTIAFDNFNARGLGNNYGGESWFLDGSGGANGIGRTNGRTSFDVYINPNCVQTPQWRGLLTGGQPSAFDPEYDSVNDMRLIIRTLDIGSAGINANADSGIICIGSIRMDRYLIPSIFLSEVIYNTPLSNLTHAPFTYDQSPREGVIDDANHLARYALDTDTDRATLLPAVDTDPPNRVYTVTSLYPVLWSGSTLYRATARLQMADPADAADPPDLIGLLFDTPTVELGQTSVSARGGPPDNMFRSASPRPPDEAGGSQTYVAFFFSQNATQSSFAGLNRVRPMLDLFNVPELYGTGTGASPVEVLSLEMSRMVPPQ